MYLIFYSKYNLTTGIKLLFFSFRFKILIQLLSILTFFYFFVKIIHSYLLIFTHKVCIFFYLLVRLAKTFPDIIEWLLCFFLLSDSKIKD